VASYVMHENHGSITAELQSDQVVLSASQALSALAEGRAAATN